MFPNFPDKYILSRVTSSPPLQKEAGVTNKRKERIKKVAKAVINKSERSEAHFWRKKKKSYQKEDTVYRFVAVKEQRAKIRRDGNTKLEKKMKWNRLCTVQYLGLSPTATALETFFFFSLSLHVFCKYIVFTHSMLNWNHLWS